MSLLAQTDEYAIRPDNLIEIALGVYVIQGSGHPMVPNIGIVVGDHSILMIDTGAGTKNGERGSAMLSQLGEGRKRILSFTHMHPEHHTGFPAFEDMAVIACHFDQVEEAERLRVRSRGAAWGDILAVVPDRLFRADIIYRGSSHTLDLGGKTVRLSNWGTAHSGSDTTFHVIEAGVVFMGDLVEEGCFPVFPWFPPNSVSVNGRTWAAILRRCLAEQPRIVVPGHGNAGSDELLRRYLEYLEGLEDEIARAAASYEQGGFLVETIRARMENQFASWGGRQWIGPAVHHFIAMNAGMQDCADSQLPLSPKSDAEPPAGGQDQSDNQHHDD